MSKRYCTVPKIFGLREWFEGKFGDLCKVHDEDYAQGYLFGGCKTCKDLKFVHGIAQRGYVGVSIATLIVLVAWLPLYFKWANRA